MVSFSTRIPSELPYLYAYNHKIQQLPSKFSMLVVLGYSAALTIMEGSIFPQYEFMLN